MSAIPTTVTIAGRKFQLLFGANALRRLEKIAGYSVTTIGVMLVNGRGGLGLVQEVIWAGLEGARLKIAPQQPELSVDEVGDLIDEHPGGMMALCEEDGDFMPKLVEAWSSAFPVKRKETKPPDPPAAADHNPDPALTTGGTT